MSQSRYLRPAQRQRTATEVKLSRFITTIAPTADRAASAAFVHEIQQEFADANHNCYARVIGAPGTTTEAGMSDDGEPQGAAGKPLLTTLLHSGIGDITVVVSRYFGGVRLGKGGMIRAYTQALQHALQTLATEEYVPRTFVRLTLDYPLLERVQQMLQQYEAVIKHTDYTEQVSITLQLPQEYLQIFCDRIRDLSNANIRVTMDK